MRIKMQVCFQIDGGDIEGNGNQPRALEVRISYMLRNSLVFFNIDATEIDEQNYDFGNNLSLFV